jgi:hypothetical protein
MEFPMKSEAQLAIYIDQHESTSQAEASCTAVLSIEELGKQIVVLVEAGDKAKSQSNDRFTSAGLMLIEAKSRVPNFKAFLRDHCNGLSRSRAYELIDMTLGKREKVHAKTNERKQRYRARVRSGTDTKTASVLPTSASGALAAFKVAVNTWLPKMDEATRHEALAFANAWRPTPAPETSHSSCELVKPPRAREMPIEDA